MRDVNLCNNRLKCDFNDAEFISIIKVMEEKRRTCTYSQRKKK